MALPAYDATKHHVGLGVDGSEKGFIVQAYQAMLQQAPTITEFGSTRELVDAPSLSRWTMDDFLGGAYWSTWLPEDDAVFSGCKNFVPNQQGRTLRTTAPLVLWDDEVGSGTGAFKGAVTFGDYLYSCWTNAFVRTKITDKTRTIQSPLTNLREVKAKPALDQYVTKGDLMVLYIPVGSAGALNLFKRIKLTDHTELAEQTGPGTGSYAITGAEFGGVVPLVASANGKLYTTSDLDTATPVWTEVAKLKGTWTDSCVYNGLAYILTVDSSAGTRIFTCDGSALTPLVEFPFAFSGTALFAYGGRIYVAGTGRDFSGEDTYAELYEITGSSLRLIKTFAAEDRVSGATDVPTAPRALAAYEGFLILGAEGEKLIVYDVTTDAIYGGPELPNAGGVLSPQSLLVARDQLFCYAIHSSDSAKTGYYRVAQTGDGVTSYSPEFITADFGPEPSLDKAWSQVHLLSRYDVSAPTVDYSTDGGASWTAATVTSTASGSFRKTVADLTPAGQTRTIRLRFRFPRGANVANWGELVAFTLTFAFVETGKRSWVFSIPGVQFLEQMDGSAPQGDLASLNTTLWGWANGGQRLRFIDIDGSEFEVQIRGLSKYAPVVGDVEEGGVREGHFRVTLVEV